MTEQEKQCEYKTVALLISALANICAAPSDKIVDHLTGFLWDEEEAGDIKSAGKNFSRD